MLLDMAAEKNALMAHTLGGFGMVRAKRADVELKAMAQEQREAQPSSREAEE
jgi:hypothetical protein